MLSCRRCFSFFLQDDFALGSASVSVADDISSNNPSRRNGKVSELHEKYDHLVAQFSNMSSKCATWRSLAQERVTNIIDLQASLAMFEDSFKLLEGLFLLMEMEKKAIAFEQDACSETSGMKTWVVYRRC